MKFRIVGTIVVIVVLAAVAAIVNRNQSNPTPVHHEQTVDNSQFKL